MPRGRADKVSQPDVDLDLGLAAVDVSYKGRPVGKLAATSEGPLAFEYDNEWLAKGFSISPLSLPLTPGVSVAKPEPLSGVFGVFDDSLPDGWGRLLVDRMLRANGIEPCNVSPLVRLAIVGASGMGALEYAPRFSLPHEELPLDFDALAAECTKVLQSEPTTDVELDTLFALGAIVGRCPAKGLGFSRRGQLDRKVSFVVRPDKHRRAGVLLCQGSPRMRSYPARNKAVPLKGLRRVLWHAAIRPSAPSRRRGNQNTYGICRRPPRDVAPHPEPRLRHPHAAHAHAHP